MFSKIKNFPFGNLLIFAILMLIPIEHKYDKVLRHFLIHHTNLDKGVIKQLYFYISDLLIFLATLLFIGKRRLNIGKAGIFLFFLSLFCILSLMNSAIPVTFFHWSRASYFSLSLILPILILELTKSQSSRDLLIVLFISACFLAIFESVVGIGQYFLQKPLGLKLLGEPKKLQAIIQVANNKRWFFDGIFTSMPKEIYLFRSCGTFPHPNVLGGFLFFTLMSSYALYFILKKNTYRILLSLGIVIQIIALFLTFSRSAIFAWLGCSILWFYLLRRNHEIKILLRMLLFGLLSCLCLFYSQISSRGGLINYNFFAKSADNFRLKGHTDAFEMIKKFPLTGVGFGNFEKGGEKTLQRPVFPTHNIYLLIASEMGIGALIIFLFYIFHILAIGWQNRFDPLMATLFSIFVGFLFIGFCDFYLIFFQQGRLLFFLISGLILRGANLTQMNYLRA